MKVVKSVTTKTSKCYGQIENEYTKLNYCKKLQLQLWHMGNESELK